MLGDRNQKVLKKLHPIVDQVNKVAERYQEEIKTHEDVLKKTEEFKYVETFGNENGNGNALYLLISQWKKTNS